MQKLAREFLTDAVQVQVNNAGDLRATESVDQRFEMCDDASKLNTFFQILQVHATAPRACYRPLPSRLNPFTLFTRPLAARLLRRRQAVGGAGKTIIFCEKKRGCEALKEQLGRRGVSASALHGDKSQQERDYTMQQFKSGAVRVLVATDVAGRGLDVKDVQVVINYDAPSSAEDYVHRIGRAGRAGATGTAFTLLTPSDGYVAREIARMMRKSRSGVPHALERAANMGGRDDGYRRWRS